MSLSDNSTRSLQIVSGGSTTTFTAPNTFTYKLPASGFRAGRDEVALKQLTLYYSWSNISAAKGNNVFSYTWPGSGTFQVVVADGIWGFDTLYSYFCQVMKQNGHYLLDANSNEVYFIAFVVNPALYCISLTVTPLPTSLPAGWSNPGAISFVTTAGQTPQLVIPAGMATLTGFAAGTYPVAPQASIYQANSGIPQITDATSMNVLCNLVNNSGFSLTPNVLTSFVIPSGTASGALIQIQPTQLDWVPISSDTFSEVTLQLVDQCGRPLVLRDTGGFVAILNLRRRL